ncbi:MAG: zinc ribbon domain-containing protein [Anaerolineaceae bacterium]|nr:zinc ribbon domain-containing protein [Anaerolineaceae bacterium]
MPTYEYECPACGHRFEEFQSMTAKPLKVCPKCGKRRLKRLIGTGAGLIFRGSGFYSTDYRSSEYTKQAKAEKSSGGDSGGSKESKSESSTGDGKTDGKTKASASDQA